MRGSGQLQGVVPEELQPPSLEMMFGINNSAALLARSAATADGAGPSGGQVSISNACTAADSTRASATAAASAARASTPADVLKKPAAAERAGMDDLEGQRDQLGQSSIGDVAAVVESEHDDRKALTLYIDTCVDVPAAASAEGVKERDASSSAQQEEADFGKEALQAVKEGQGAIVLYGTDVEKSQLDVPGNEASSLQLQVPSSTTLHDRAPAGASILMLYALCGQAEDRDQMSPEESAAMEAASKLQLGEQLDALHHRSPSLEGARLIKARDALRVQARMLRSREKALARREALVDEGRTPAQLEAAVSVQLRAELKGQQAAVAEAERRVQAAVAEAEACMRREHADVLVGWECKVAGLQLQLAEEAIDREAAQSSCSAAVKALEVMAAAQMAEAVAKEEAAAARAECAGLSQSLAAALAAEAVAKVAATAAQAECAELSTAMKALEASAGVTKLEALKQQHAAEVRSLLLQQAQLQLRIDCIASKTEVQQKAALMETSLKELEELAELVETAAPNLRMALKEKTVREARTETEEHLTKCGICWDMRSNRRLNCGHIFCNSCALQIEKCPSCQSDITCRELIYL